MNNFFFYQIKIAGISEKIKRLGRWLAADWLAGGASKAARDVNKKKGNHGPDVFKYWPFLSTGGPDASQPSLLLAGKGENKNKKQKCAEWVPDAGACAPAHRPVCRSVRSLRQRRPSIIQFLQSRANIRSVQSTSTCLCVPCSLFSLNWISVFAVMSSTRRSGMRSVD